MLAQRSQILPIHVVILIIIKISRKIYNKKGFKYKRFTFEDEKKSCVDTILELEALIPQDMNKQELVESSQTLDLVRAEY